MRQDGLLQHYMTVSFEEAELIINRIGFVALDIEKRLPQDRRWSWSHKNKSVTMRVSHCLAYTEKP